MTALLSATLFVRTTSSPPVILLVGWCTAAKSSAAPTGRPGGPGRLLVLSCLLHQPLLNLSLLLSRLLRHRIQLLTLPLKLLLRGNAPFLLQPLLLLLTPLSLFVATLLFLLFPLAEPFAPALFLTLLFALGQTFCPLFLQRAFKLLQLLVEDVATLTKQVVEILLLLLLHAAETVAMLDVALAL